MDKLKNLCTICARGGSKGVKNKNLREINGKPLIAYTIEQAKESGLFTAVVVSSDSQAILETSKQWGADIIIKRPDEMATDNVAKLPAIVHAAKEAEKILNIEHDVFVDMDATSPLRNVDDIKGAVELLIKNNVNSVITGSPARRSPYFNLVEECRDGSVALSKKLDQAIVRRQDSPKCYDMNASIYVWVREALFNDSPCVFYPDTKIFVMPEERSLDIDTPLDFEIVEFLIKNHKIR